ncbi:Uma2 family endonuclease [Pendulispora rubella]|uniref:Uma2 family endonuclease n=1 Tax=Pendulispora rubella TaxID=2741070 RepID=A0ABZ2LES8_9BACT
MQTYILEHATPRRFARAEYDRMLELGFFRGEHVELIRGTLLQMAPTGPQHASRVTALMEAFVPPLLNRATVRVQQPFVAHDESEPAPDVALVPFGPYAGMHPERAFLVVEVADSSLEYDRTTKAALYAESGVDEYWIVNLRDGAVEVHGAPTDGRYARIERVTKGAMLAPLAFPDAVVPLDRLFPPAG